MNKKKVKDVVIYGTLVAAGIASVVVFRNLIRGDIKFKDFGKTKGLVTTYGGNAPTNRAVPDGYLIAY